MPDVLLKNKNRGATLQHITFFVLEKYMNECVHEKNLYFKYYKCENFSSQCNAVVLKMKTMSCSDGSLLDVWRKAPVLILHTENLLNFDSFFSAIVDG